MKRRRRAPFEFEHVTEPLAPPRVFRARMLRSAALAAGIIAFSLLIGVVGYHTLAGIPSWVDCVYNASMILGGMGPVAEIGTEEGKIFASVYALYSGVVLLASVGVLLSPALHRVLHHFHLERDEDGED
ncbi:MAG: hypothetical protein IT347_04675 [Candidatus Eisenbacteria bacterium]|nr:hypothetical protein [Candidatus Eisenbacteria bacterium]